MFTGIVEEMGTLKAIRKGPHSAVLEIQAKVVLEDIHLGDSIAVNGVCLTATSYSPTGFTADVMHETLNRSALATLRPRGRLNLYLSMSPNLRVGRDIEAGQVDGVGTVLRITRDDIDIWYTIAAGPEILRYVVEKGSITVDGISLTVAWVEAHRFAVSIIPHTASVTLLGEKGVGDVVNLETDLLAKYVEKLLRPQEAPQPERNITWEFLAEHGF